VVELAELPGIGPSRARAIVERREAVPFERVEELLAIRGIGDSVYAKLRERVVVEETVAMR
jgi:competence protein ComEA